MKKLNSLEMLNLDSKKRNELLIFASANPHDVLFQKFSTSPEGLSEESVEKNRAEYGLNKIRKEKQKTLFFRLSKAFINPFSIILFFLAIVSFLTDFLLANDQEKNPITSLIILGMITISGLMRFIQESKSSHAAEQLSNLVRTTTAVTRQGKTLEIPLDQVVVGDIVTLAAGDIIPADIKIIKAKDLFLSQASLTGESEPFEKETELKKATYDMITERPNLAFMGTNVISGSGSGLVVAVGDQTLFGEIAQFSSEKVEKTSFEKGVQSVSGILIKFMFLMVPLVFAINGFTKGDWLSAFLFGISIAVGLTPEMLPMVMTACLAKGAVSMAKKDTIIKNLNSIQNFGAIDVLCTDKTGTLTQDKVVLQLHLDLSGKEDPRVLKHAFLNSYFHTGYKNLMDVSIIEKTQELSEKLDHLKDLSNQYTKVDEVPFDFARRRMSVVVQDKFGKTQMITKGAVEEIISICNFVDFGGRVEPIREELKKQVFNMVVSLQNKGMRVLAVSQKNEVSPVGVFSVKDESSMVLIGYLAFLDPPKPTTKNALHALKSHGLSIKVLTGDGDRVTRSICSQVGLKIENLLLGKDVEEMDEKTLGDAVEKTNIFAKLTPAQKARVVKALRNNGHVVGYMGDGINDVAALKAADVGISVDTAVDIAKESAHVILLKKDLMVLEEGILEGRRAFANMMKYIKITASSNFGNMLSVLLASAFLPFLPMLPVQILFLNLAYDLSFSVIPWDHVDAEIIQKPKQWMATSIGKFMLFLGSISSIFDITTYLVMFFVIAPWMLGGNYFAINREQQTLFMMIFQTGWFVESMFSQTIVIHMFRTEKIPFIQSRASPLVMATTSFAVTFLTILPFTSFGEMLRLTSLPWVYFPVLGLTITLYLLLAFFLKRLYIRRFGSLL